MNFGLTNHKAHGILFYVQYIYEEIPNQKPLTLAVLAFHPVGSIQLERTIHGLRSASDICVFDYCKSAINHCRQWDGSARARVRVCVRVCV